MIEVLTGKEQENLVNLIENTGLCNSDDRRRTFLIEIDVKPQENRVELNEHDFLVNLINLLVEAKKQESLRLILKRISPFCERQKIRYLENKLNTASYKPSPPTAKLAYFADSRVFQLMPLDIGTIWGLQRSSFIGLLIGFEQTEIYENLKNVEFFLSQAIESNQKENKLATKLPKREWIRLDINQYPGVPCQKAHILDAVVDISNEAVDRLKNNDFKNTSIPGFFFDIDAHQLHQSGSEKIENWCNALVSELFPSQAIAIIVNIIASIDEDFVQIIERFKNNIRQNLKNIPIECMRLDYRFFFEKNNFLNEVNNYSFINRKEKPGLLFCSWINHNVICNLLRVKLEREKSQETINLFINLKEQYSYSDKELQDAYSKVTVQDIVLDIQAVAPTILEKIYFQLLEIIIVLFPHWSYEWVFYYAKSRIKEAVCTALVVASNADLLSDLLMDAWVDAITIEMYDLDIIDLNNVLNTEIYGQKKIKIESLFLAILRKRKNQNKTKLNFLTKKLVFGFNHLQALDELCLNQEANEDDFLKKNDANQLTLALRANVKFERTLNQFKAAPVSHIPPAICWLLAIMTPSQKNITELLNLEPKKRAIFGLCTNREWQQIKKRQEREREVLDCRRDRSLIFDSHLS